MTKTKLLEIAIFYSGTKAVRSMPWDIVLLQFIDIAQNSTNRKSCVKTP